MQTTLVLTNSHLAEIRNAASLEVESAGVMIAKLVITTEKNRRLIIQHIHWVPDASYNLREKRRLEVPSNGFIPALRHAADSNAIAIWLHTHPVDYPPLPSKHDDVVDRELAETFRVRTRSDFYGQLIVSQFEGETSFSGFLEDATGTRQQLDRMWSVGSRFELLEHYGANAEQPLELFSRNILAFGPAIQHALGQLHIGIVGCGGTGSAVTEQLVRLGVRRFTLLDDETLEDSNVTRVYGSTPLDLGTPKVDIQKRNVEHIAPDSVVRSASRKVTEEDAARLLDDCDVVFGCTDDNAGRVILSRFACVMMVPLVDLGVILDSTDQVLTGIFCRVTLVAPGDPCLICRNNIDMEMAKAEQMPSEMRQGLVADGYAPEMPGTEPAVAAFTTMTASFAVSELLNRLTDFGDGDQPSEILILPHLHRITRVPATPRSGHYCDPSGSKQFGAAITTPFLGIAWTA